MKIAIAIATAGRREGLSETIDFLRRQTRAPDALYVCPAGDNDLDPECLKGFPAPTHVVRGARGLPAQRNTIMRAATDMDVLFFIDDDYIPDPLSLNELEALFTRHPDLSIATGDVIADGINGPGITFEKASALIDTLKALPSEKLKPVFNGYGCNMAVRMDMVRAQGLEFDENLPLYGWWEDVDFSRRLAPFGSILYSNRLRGVHMGSKSGRTPGKKLGYSQVMNIIYMIKKGSVPFNVGFVRIARNVVANLVRMFKPEPWVDRRGRVVGNFIAFGDALCGKINPRKILEM
jgi:GT2 family glycosyltransferase